MEKDKLISLITSGQSIEDDPKISEWINEAEENKDEYIRYKNLWALMQRGNEITDEQIKEGLTRIRKGPVQAKRMPVLWNIMKYAAFVVLALLGGYLIGNKDFGHPITFNEVFVPKGNRSSILLADGTKVWLNNGTKLIYPDHFDGKERQVEMDGEGFFEVAHDKEHPFIVKIGGNRIKVLGTRFAVMAYSQDNIVKADLVSGKIQFDVHKGKIKDAFISYYLKPSQSLVFDKSSGKVSESKIQDNFYSYWVKGIYEFKDEPFENLAKKIERIYNVQVIFKDEALKKRLFTGSLSINDNIYTMMEVFKRASQSPFAYSHEGNKIFVGEKN